MHDLVAELGGSISAEHGLGQLKRQEILRYKSEVEMDLMRKVAVEQDAAIIAVTHDEKIFNRFDRIFSLRDGRLETSAAVK